MAENIFHLASSNTSSLEFRFSELEEVCLSENRRDILMEFVDNAYGGHLSYNVKLGVLITFLKVGNIENIHERFEDEFSKKEALDEYSKVRLNFEYSFEDGKKFKYAALNMGNAGLLRWGAFCLIFGIESRSNTSDMVFVRDNTLKKRDDQLHFYYFTDGDELILEKLANDLSVFDLRGKLAGIKHSNEIENDNKHLWPDILCKDKENYLEMITTNDMVISDVKEVRFDKSIFKLLGVNSSLSGSVDKTDNIDINIFRDIRKQLKEQRIPLNIV